MFGGLGMQEVIIVLIVAVLLFGKRLPEVAKNLGSTYRDFRKGLSDLQSQIDFGDTPSYPAKGSSSSYESYDQYDDYEEDDTPKFEPPPLPPQSEEAK